MSPVNIQSEKKAHKLFLLGKYQKKQNQAKPLISLRGILKGVKITGKQIKATRISLFTNS